MKISVDSIKMCLNGAHTNSNKCAGRGFAPVPNTTRFGLDDSQKFQTKFLIDQGGKADLRDYWASL